MERRSEGDGDESEQVEYDDDDDDNDFDDNLSPPSCFVEATTRS